MAVTKEDVEAISRAMIKVLNDNDKKLIEKFNLIENRLNKLTGDIATLLELIAEKENSKK